MYYNRFLSFLRETYISLQTKFQIMKVHAILREVYTDLPEQITEMVRSYKMVEAILNSDHFIKSLNSNISGVKFTVEQFIAKFKVDSGDTIGWVVLQY